MPKDCAWNSLHFVFGTIMACAEVALHMSERAAGFIIEHTLISKPERERVKEVWTHDVFGSQGTAKPDRAKVVDLLINSSS